MTGYGNYHNIKIEHVVIDLRVHSQEMLNYLMFEMYDDESIFWFQKGEFCVLSRAEKFENVAGGNLSVVPSWLVNVTSGVTSRVAK